MSVVFKFFDMRKIAPIVFIIVLLGGTLQGTARAQSVALREEFTSLANWKHYQFPKVDRLSEYSVVAIGNDSVLRTSSDNSASALLLQKTFKVDSFPVLRWRWKVQNIYQNGDEVTKAGDDYALRIYVNFKYEPEYASFLDRAKYSMAKAIFGEYPPHSALSYIWANRTHNKRILPNPFQKEKTKMVIVREGKACLGVWKTEEVNILENYREAFGRAPPDIASLAIMNDSDGTGEKSVSYLDYIILQSGKNEAGSQ